MGNKQIRTGELISPFGPGSIYTDRRGVPHIVAGLDHWFKQWDASQGRMVSCINAQEFERFEPRLSALLRVARFCAPPDYRAFRRTKPADQPPPNANLFVPALRFPRWYRQTKTGELRRFNLDAAQLPNPPGGGRWQPVRFISVCAAGHLGEFPWKQWINCQCAGDGNLFLTDRGGSELTSIRIECRSCPSGSLGRQGRSLAMTTIKPNIALGEQSEFQKAGIACPGDRPWLGEGANEPSCSQPLVAGLINQTNIYFPRTISAITLPDLQVVDDSIAQLRSEIEQDQSPLGSALTRWRTGDGVERSDVAADIQRKLARRGVQASEEDILKALQSLFDNSGATVLPMRSPAAPESDFVAFRRAEFDIIRNQVNDPQNASNLRVIPADVPEELSGWFARVNLVERLRETRVFYGFDRLDQNNNALLQMPDIAMRQLFRDQPATTLDRWLPAVEVFGEGIYVELNEERIRTWQDDNESWLAGRLDDGFIARLGGVFQTFPPLGAANREWASRYLLVHSLAHILINQLVFECGYSTASLRERLYVSPDSAAPMAAFMIYTAAGDAEGTLGGLVRLGRPERLGPVVRRALGRASWCSADPVCSEHLGGQGSKLANLAACHACVLLPETSCETINQGLDRAMVIGTPYARTTGFMSGLPEE